MMRSFVIAAVVVILLGMTTGIQANQILNGSFQDSALSCWGPPPADWQGYGGYLRVFDSTCPWGGVGYNSTQFAGESWVYGVRKQGGIYQQIICNAGSTGTFRVMWNIFNSGSVINIRSGIDPTGGTDPNSDTVQWSPTKSFSPTDNGDFPVNPTGWGNPADPNSWLETPEITSVGKKVTCFITYDAIPGPGGIVRFDIAEVTGSLVDYAEETFPPHVRNMSLAGDPVMGPVDINYELFEPNRVASDDTDPPAQLVGRDGGLHGDYRLGGVFNTTVMPAGFRFDIQPASYTYASTEQGDYTHQGFNPGVGTLWVRGLGHRTPHPTDQHYYWRDIPDAGQPGGYRLVRNGPNLIADMFGNANEPVQVIAKFSHWEDSADEFNPIVNDYEGVGVYMSTPDKQNFYSVGGFQDEGPFNTGIGVGAYFSFIGSRNGWNNDFWINMQGDPVTNARPLWLSIRRFVDPFGQRAIASYSRTSDAPQDMTDIHAINLEGTGLEFNKTLQFGIYFNEGIIADLDYYVSNWRPCTNGPGGDGVTGLACTPAGDAHVYQWDAADLLPFYNRNGMAAPDTQFALRGVDQDGPGPFTQSDWNKFGVAPVVPSHVQEWTIFE